jgi:hypothetical protein
VKPQLPTGKYAGCQHWAAVIKSAKLRPRLQTLVANYEKTGHPACLNAIMDNADANLWITFYTGAETKPV